jgi:hypothetical protein
MRIFVFALALLGMAVNTAEAEQPGATLMDLATCTAFYTVLRESWGEETSRVSGLDKVIVTAREKAGTLAGRLGTPFETWENITANTTDSLRPPGPWTYEELVERYNARCAEVLYR